MRDGWVYLEKRVGPGAERMNLRLGVWSDQRVIILTGLLVHKVETSPHLPSPVHGRRLVRVDRPVAGQPPEVVDSELVVQVEGALHALRPPRIVVLLHRLPVVQRAAPQLPRRTERVGWDAAHCRWLARLLVLQSRVNLSQPSDSFLNDFVVF